MSTPRRFTFAPPPPPVAPSGRVLAQMRAAYAYNKGVDAQVAAGRFTASNAPYAEGTTSLEDLKTLSQRHGIPITSPSTPTSTFAPPQSANPGVAVNGQTPSAPTPTYRNPALNTAVQPPAAQVISGNAADVGQSITNAAAADRQSTLGSAYGSSRIVPDAAPTPTPLPSANDPQHTVATVIHPPGGGTVTIPAYSNTPDNVPGGIYVDGKPMVHDDSGNLVADLSRAGGGVSPASYQNPALGAISGGAKSVVPPTPSLFHPPTYQNDALNAIASGASANLPPPAVTGTFFHPVSSASFSPGTPLPPGTPGVASAPGTAKEVPISGGLAGARDAAKAAGLPTGNPGVIASNTQFAPLLPSETPNEASSIPFPQAAPVAPIPTINRLGAAPAVGGTAKATASATSTQPAQSPIQGNLDAINSVLPGARPGQFTGAADHDLSASPLPTAPAVAAVAQVPGAPPPSGAPPPLNLPGTGSDQSFAPKPLDLTGTATPSAGPGPQPSPDHELQWVLPQKKVADSDS